jgi:hypothetical protein
MSRQYMERKGKGMHEKERQVTVRHDNAWKIMARKGKTCQRKAWLIMERHGKDRHGISSQDM